MGSISLPNDVYKRIQWFLPLCFRLGPVFRNFLDALRQLFILLAMLLVKSSYCLLGEIAGAQCFRSIALIHLDFLALLLESGHRSTEARLCKLSCHCQYVPLSQIISCLPLKILCQVTEATTVMSIWNFGYNVHQFYLLSEIMSLPSMSTISSCRWMRNVAQHPYSPTPWWQTRCQRYGFTHHIRRPLKDCWNTSRLNTFHLCIYPPQMTLLATDTRSKYLWWYICFTGQGCPYWGINR